MTPRALGPLALLALALACGPAPAPKPIAPPAAQADPFDPSGKWPHFTSNRFGVIVSLPDGKGWRIDDHSKPYLTATHAATSSELTLATWFDDELMSRSRCESRARLDKLFPDIDFEEVEDARVEEPEGFDTRLLVAVEPKAKPGVIIGHVIAVGGYIKKCLFFHFQTEVKEGDKDVLSARLALVRTRVLGEMKLAKIEDVPREKR